MKRRFTYYPTTENSFIENGVYVVDQIGNYYTTSNWENRFGITGIALKTNNVSIIIAPDEWKTSLGDGDGNWGENNMSAWGGWGVSVVDCTSTTDESRAKIDYSGELNTNAIINRLKGTSDSYKDTYQYVGAPAAEYCKAYSKGCKEIGQWYLPSFGELTEMVNNRIELNNAINLVSGEVLFGDFTWSSTQYNSEKAWRYYGINVNFGNKYSGHYVRPVCKIT